MKFWTKRQYVAWWIDFAWKSITTSTITNTWRRCLAYNRNTRAILPPTVPLSEVETRDIEQEDDFLFFENNPFHNLGETDRQLEQARRFNESTSHLELRIHFE
jgi:hypothetical protein